MTIKLYKDTSGQIADMDTGEIMPYLIIVQFNEKRFEWAWISAIHLQLLLQMFQDKNIALLHVKNKLDSIRWFASIILAHNPKIDTKIHDIKELAGEHGEGTLRYGVIINFNLIVSQLRGSVRHREFGK